MEDDDKAPLYNRSFQKKEVVKKLVKNEACEKISTPLEIPGMRLWLAHSYPWRVFSRQ